MPEAWIFAALRAASQSELAQGIAIGVFVGMVFFGWLQLMHRRGKRSANSKRVTQ